jgi:gluconate 2-dehydrogenase gamma chain
MNTPATIDRRELLKRVAYLMGGAVSAPAVMGLLQGCAPKKPSVDWQPEFFTAAQAGLVARVADIMIPRTDTPGAVDAGVPQFIDAILKGAYPKADQDRYLAGLQQFDERASQAHGKPFVNVSEEQQVALVREVHDEALRAAQTDSAARQRNQRPFILMTKELTMLGFFSSEAGSTQVLQYIQSPGPFKGCLPLSETGNGRTWGGDTNVVF